MRARLFFIHASKETPAEAELISHQLMLRAGFIRKQASGIYSWLPSGWRVASKIATIVRQEMDAAGAAEVFMPAVQPAKLWQESGRWEEYGPELLRIADRHGRDFCMGPTHEEVVTDIVRGCVSSYRQLPFNLYQIQTKFRDEIRPRFGVMRAREFIMKDAYSFDIDVDGMRKSYEIMRAAYCRIFDRIGLRYRMVEADSGTIGGDVSHEFMVLADSGEEIILYCEQSGYAANRERTACLPSADSRPSPEQELQKVHTPGVKTIEQLKDFLGDSAPPISRNIKTMLVKGDVGAAAILLQGGHKLNLIKASAQPEIGGNAELIPAKSAKELVGAGFGSLGPINMSLPVIADYGLTATADFICGANEDDYHYVGGNFGRDCPEPRFADVRDAVAGDMSPDKKGVLAECRGIEVGHIFQLGDKYSKAMAALAEAPDSGALPIMMGCYGIGITRIVAAAIEQGHDSRGIIFPDAIAPFTVVVAAIGGQKNDSVREATEKLYQQLLTAGIDVLLDDRDVRPGVMFAELDLLGIPHRLVIGERGLASSQVEYKHRAADETVMIPLDEVVAQICEKVSG
ncbi:MAG: proline--tRNA ligase [Gammaproteobacteria bacterium WSBS_2016_MAG_OTU1]